jgi:hypothetical protein
MTAADRCVGHVGGTAGEDGGARSLVRWPPARPQGEAVLDDHVPRWQALRRRRGRYCGDIHRHQPIHATPTVLIAVTVGNHRIDLRCGLLSLDPRNVFAPCAVLAGRKPLAVAGRRIQKVHALSSRNGPLTRATSSLDRHTTMPSMARHRSDDCGSSADENVGRSARIHQPVACCEPSFDGGRPLAWWRHHAAWKTTDRSS